MRNSREGIIGEAIADCGHGGLERSCKRAEGFRTGPAPRGMERIEAAFSGTMFSPHRHDTYALGLTLSGIQTFSYRGERRFSEPGKIIVLHPDEVHDGAAGTEDGLLYRMLYVPPELITAALHGKTALPFVSAPVLCDPALARALAEALADLGREPDELRIDDILMRVAFSLARHADGATASSGRIDATAVDIAADYLRAHATQTFPSARLEALTGLDRYSLARHFRSRMGTSPHRFQIMRRLEQARICLLRDDRSLADVAGASGFADQAHFTRHFKACYGITPGRWRALAKPVGSSPKLHPPAMDAT